MVLVVEVKGGAAVETIGSTPHSCRSRLNKSNQYLLYIPEQVYIVISMVARLYAKNFCRSATLHYDQ